MPIDLSGDGAIFIGHDVIDKARQTKKLLPKYFATSTNLTDYVLALDILLGLPVVLPYNARLDNFVYELAYALLNKQAIDQVPIMGRNGPIFLSEVLYDVDNTITKFNVLSLILTNNLLISMIVH